VLIALTAASLAWSKGRAIGPDPVVQKWTEWPYPVTCSTLAFDPIAVFGWSTAAEAGSGGPERALRRFLREPGWDWIPKRNWRLLTRTAGAAEFVQGFVSNHPENQMSALSFRKVRGRWKWMGSGGCILRSVRNHLPAAEWNLDFDSPLPSAGAEAITVRVEERSCTSGQQPYDRLQQPEVRYTDTAAFISFWVTPLKGGQTCQGILPDPYELRLPAPLGDRRLYDGGTYPPRLIKTS
jgi:hypothetical protein